MLAQARYALGALICLISTQASVFALAIVQLYSIVSPWLPHTGRQRAKGSQDQ